MLYYPQTKERDTVFFEKEYISAIPIGVWEIKQYDINMLIPGRSYDALSIRIRSDAKMTAGDNSYTTSQYSICYVPAGLSYRRIASYDELIAIDFQCANLIGNQIEHFVPQQPELFLPLFQQILQIWTEKKPGYRYRATAIMYELFALCYQQNAKPHHHPSKLQVAVEYMHQNCTRHDLTVGEIAQKVYISEVYFRKLFHQEFNISPQKYLIKLRLQTAVALMNTGHYSLKEVAALSGYGDYKYFSVEFKRFYDLSPSEYAKRLAYQIHN